MKTALKSPGLGTIEIIDSGYHRNGIGGYAFVAVEFLWRQTGEAPRMMVATISYFENNKLDYNTCRVLDTRDINECFHGDRFGAVLVEMIGNKFDNE